MSEQTSPPPDEEVNKQDNQPAEPPPARKSWKEGLPGIESSPETHPEVKPSRHIGRWALILLATLVVGFGAAYFALALPAQQELKQARADLAAAQEKLGAAESELEVTSRDLDETSGELASAQYGLALARVQANVAYARASLVSRDLLTARQEVSAAVANLQGLLPFIKDKEISAALSDRMDGIDKAVYTDSSKALEELRILSENLLRLED